MYLIDHLVAVHKHITESTTRADLTDNFVRSKESALLASSLVRCSSISTCYHAYRAML